MQKPFRRIASSADDAERLVSPSTEIAKLNLRRSLMFRTHLLRLAAREAPASQFQPITMIVFALRQIAIGASCSPRRQCRDTSSLLKCTPTLKWRLGGTHCP